MLHCIMSEYDVDASSPVLRDGVSKALAWQSKTSPQERIAFRERMMQALEQTDARQRLSGLLDEWYAGVNEEIREVHRSARVVCVPYVILLPQVSGETNGLLLYQLAVIAGHCDLDCVEFFRRGLA
jgi:hypothetical protein